MFKIGEFSQMVQVSTRMLRHYDKLGLLQPSVVDHFTGYRYYTLDQIPRLNRLLALKDLGFSLTEIGSLLNDQISVAEMQGMLKMRQAEINRTLMEEQHRLARVAARLRQIEQEGQTSREVVIKQPTALSLASQRHVVPRIEDMAHYRCSMFAETYDWLMQRHIEPAGTELVIYYGSEFMESQIDMETAVPIPDEALDEFMPYPHETVQLRKLSSSHLLASTILQGSIYDLPQVITALFTWIHGNGFECTDVIHELHLSGTETSDTDFDNVLFEIQIPVMAKSL